jgi:hypothetical protein
MEKKESKYKVLATFKDNPTIGIFLLPVKNYNYHRSGLLLQEGIKKILPLYNKYIRDNSRAAFKRGYKSIGFRYKIVDNDDLIVQITTKDNKDQPYFHQYYITPVRLDIQEVENGS